MSNGQHPLGMTVGQLRAALAGHSDEMTVVVRTNDYWEDLGGGIGGIHSAGAEDGCADETYFAIDVSNDNEDFDEAEEA